MAAETRSPTHNYRIADAPLHFVDFLQKTDGIRALIASMDQTGVDHTMISGMLLVKKWEAADLVSLIISWTMTLPPIGIASVGWIEQ
jgi:hypothetical protein